MVETCYKGNHLIDITNLSRETIETLLKRAYYWETSPEKEKSICQNRFVANLFFEPSTRTRFSFEVAEQNLGMQTLHFDQSTSSMEKNESLYDTVKTLAHLGVEVLVLRHWDDDIMNQLLQQDIGCSILNAGAGIQSHPTQALLDLYTIHKHFKQLEGLRVAIVGDIAHSRVARSTVAILRKFGVEVILSGPESMSAKDLWTDVPFLCFDDLLTEIDVVMLLRVQLERHQEESLTPENYLENYGLTPERFARMKPEALIMHPGPVNRGVEICHTLVEHPRSKIFEQMSNGVYVRMAALEYALEAI